MLSEDDLIILHVLENAANDARMGISTYGPELLRSVRLRYAKRIMDQPTERPAVITHVEEDRDLNRAITQAVDELQERAAMCEQARDLKVNGRRVAGWKEIETSDTWEFDRFRNGKLMAEGGKVSAFTEDEAIEKVKALFRDCPGDTFRLRNQHPPTPDRGIVEEVAQELADWAKKLEPEAIMSPGYLNTVIAKLNGLAARLRSSQKAL